MSNRAIIYQQTATVRHNGDQSKEVVVSDDYGMGVIWINSETGDEDFFDDELELLKYVIKVSDEEGIEDIEQILTNLQLSEKGITIEGQYYEWEQIKPIFEEMEQ